MAPARHPCGVLLPFLLSTFVWHCDGQSTDQAGQVFRMIVATPFAQFRFYEEFLPAILPVLQDLSVKPRPLYLCPESACPGLSCARSHSLFLSRGCNAISTSRRLRTLQNGGTYIEFDLVDDPRGTPQSLTLPQRQQLGWDRIRNQVSGTGTALSAFGPKAGMVDSRTQDVVVPTPAPTVAPPPTSGQGGTTDDDDDDVTSKWWFWVLVALAILLLLLLLYCMCCKKKKKGAKDRGQTDGGEGGPYERAYGNSGSAPSGTPSERQAKSVGFADHPPQSHYTDGYGTAPSHHGYLPGDQVEALYDGQWHPATVLRASPNDTYTVQWREDDTVTEMIPPEELRPLTRSQSPMPNLAVGKEVLCHCDDDQWHPATVEGFSPGGRLTVRWSRDGS
eukprot:Sspe_Gene.34494::Locus_16768_Transcript_1_1_Confidence_1.000_Length_1207::g.34494::m.34494